MQTIEQVKLEVKAVEESFRHFEDFGVKDISAQCEKIYASFNEFQLQLIEEGNKVTQKKLNREIYLQVYKLLSFLESELDPTDFVYLTKKSKSFVKIFNHLSTFCSKFEMEQEVNVELTKEICSAIEEVAKAVNGEIKLKTLDEFIQELKKEL